MLIWAVVHMMYVQATADYPVWLRLSGALKPVLRGVSRMIPRREGGWTGLLHSTSCLNKSHVIRGNKMTITNPVKVGRADDCKHRDSTQYWEQSKTSINICWVSEWRIFGLCFTSDGLFWYVQEPRVHLLFCICKTSKNSSWVVKLFTLIGTRWNWNINYHLCYLKDIMYRQWSP